MRKHLDVVVTFKHLLIAVGVVLVYKAYEAYVLIYRMSDYLSQLTAGVRS